MYSSVLLLSSVMAPGGDVTPVGWGEGRLAPVVVQAGGQAGGCVGNPAPACCDSCGSGKVRLIDKIKARLAPKPKSCDSCAAPACPAPCAEKYYQPNLLDKIRARSAKSSCCGAAPACAAPACCGTAPVPADNPPKDVPKDMGKPKEPEKPKTADPVKSGNSPSPAPAPAPVPAVVPSPVMLPPLPAAPVSGPKPAGAGSPY